MNISAPFIARPIATSLLMIFIAVIGIAAYPLLPVAPLPTRRFSDHSGDGAASRREPRRDGFGGCDAA